MKEKNEKRKAGYGKLLDYWEPPEDAGEPVGIIATSFTFQSDFFENACLARFLCIGTDVNENPAGYLLEREERLQNLSCAIALVDQHHCRGMRTLRWDLLPVRPSYGLLHAKISLLYWSKLIRLIIASANLTEDGYRRNQEIFGVLDYKPPSLAPSEDDRAPSSVLNGIVEFLGSATQGMKNGGAKPSPIGRMRDFLSDVQKKGKEWGITDEQQARRGIRVYAVLTGPQSKYPSAFDQLMKIWPAQNPPIIAKVLSPFFGDSSDESNNPAYNLWDLLRKRGTAKVIYLVDTEKKPNDDTIIIHAPESLTTAKPSRQSTSVEMRQLKKDNNRSLHAKGLWLEDERWISYMIGSSNFTGAGMGLPPRQNMEANLVYIIDHSKNLKAYRTLSSSFPESENIDKNLKYEYKIPLIINGTGDSALLPKAFVAATWEKEDIITLQISGKPPAGWVVMSVDDRRLYDEKEWNAQGCPDQVTVTWPDENTLPSGLKIIWENSNFPAWLPVNVSSPSDLRPPDKLSNLSLEDLISIIISWRPLHEIIDIISKDAPVAKRDVPYDTLKQVDTSGFILQRVRRVSNALECLRKRLEEPMATKQTLEWRLYGPVSVMALANAIDKEERANEEKAFLLAELILTLRRVKPSVDDGCIPPKYVKTELLTVMDALMERIPEVDNSRISGIHDYLKAVLKPTIVR